MPVNLMLSKLKIDFKVIEEFLNSGLLKDKKMYISPNIGVLSNSKSLDLMQGSESDCLHNSSENMSFGSD